MDCVVLAGSGHAYKDVRGASNKAFLKIKGRPIIWYIFRELAHIEPIRRIIITGPKDEINAFLEDQEFSNYPKEIVVFEDRGDVLANALYALRNTGSITDPDRLVFVLPCDVPFIRKDEILQFFERCDMNSFDFCSGVVSAEALSRFYPNNGKPGINMAYFHAKEGDFRISNMHLVRIANVNNMDYLKKTYAMRYLKKIKNVLRMVLELMKLSFRIPGAAFYFMRMSIAGFMFRAGYTTVPNWLRRFNSTKKPEHYISTILKTRFKIVETDFGAMALDIDNDKDFETICLRFDEWNNTIDELIRNTRQSGGIET